MATNASFTLRHQLILLTQVLICLGLSWEIPSSVQARIISREDEVRIGRDLATQIAQLMPLDTDPVMTSRLKRIGERLTNTLPETPYPFEFHLIDLPEINAFAVPGGFIYVYRGLAQLLPSEDALAFVMGHEIIHVVRRHSTRQFERSLMWNLPFSLLFRGPTLGSLAGTASLLIQLHYSRTDEREADMMGLQAMVSAGYDPMGAVEAMQLLKATEKSGGKTIPLLRTHPVPDKRVQYLKEKAEEIKAQRENRNQKTDSEGASSSSVPFKFASLTPPLPAGVQAELKDLFPMEPGRLWVYRVKSPSGEGERRLYLLGRIPRSEGGMGLVKIDLEGFAFSAILTTTQRGVYLYPLTPYSSQWRLEWPYANLDLGESRVRVLGEETVKVPAGEFKALRVEERDKEGRIQQVFWFAQGVGLVQRRSLPLQMEEVLLYTRLGEGNRGEGE